MRLSSGQLLLLRNSTAAESKLLHDNNFAVILLVNLTSRVKMKTIGRQVYTQAIFYDWRKPH